MAICLLGSDVVALARHRPRHRQREPFWSRSTWNRWLEEDTCVLSHSSCCLLLRALQLTILNEQYNICARLYNLYLDYSLSNWCCQGVWLHHCPPYACVLDHPVLSDETTWAHRLHGWREAANAAAIHIIIIINPPANISGRLLSLLAGGWYW